MSFKIGDKVRWKYSDGSHFKKNEEVIVSEVLSNGQLSFDNKGTHWGPEYFTLVGGEAMFKKGDKLKCLNTLKGQFTKGKIYEVREDYAGPTGNVTICLDDGGGEHNGWGPHFFELVKNDTVQNCTPCCAICNRMKSNLAKTEFLEHIKRIAKRML